MSERVVAFALQQRLLVILLSLGVLFLGVSSLLKLPVDAYPDIAPTQVKIILKAPGMTPQEVESRITLPIELSLQSIPNQKVIRSISKYALCDITLDFDEGIDIYWARQQVAQRLGEVMESLPDGVSGGLAPITTPLGEVLMFTIESDTLDLMQKRELLDWVIARRISSLDGVAGVNSLGGYVKTYEVVPDIAKMHSLGITFAQLRESLEKNNKNEGIGRLSVGEQSLYVRTQGRLENIADIENLIITNKNARAIKIADIAEVKIGSIARAGFVTKDAQGEAVQGLILSRKGADTSAVLARVKAELKKIERDMPEGTGINIFYDRSDLVAEAIDTVSHALLEAMVLIFIVLFLFLGNFASAMSVAIILPFAAMMTFVFMEYFGVSANLMSLGGLAIAIGILVDAGVVMVENISERLSHSSSDTSEQKRSKISIVLESAKEVSGSVFTGVLIIITLFLPLLTLEGLEGKLFVPVALSIVFALSSSLILALTLIPVVSLYTLKEKGVKKVALMRFLERHYKTLLAFALSRYKILFVSVGVLWLVALFAYSATGKTFMPELDEGSVIIGIEKNPSISLESSREIDLKIQHALLEEIPEILSIVARTGSDEIGLDPMSLNDTDTFLVLKEKKLWREPSKEWLLGEIRSVLDGFVGIEYGFTQPIAMRVSEMLSGSRGDIVVKVYGEESEKIERISSKIATILESIDGSSDVYKRNNDGVAYWEMAFDDAQMARYGVSRDEIAAFMQMSINGTEVGIIQEGLRRFSLMIKGESSLSHGMQANKDLLYILDDGRAVPLSRLVKFSMSEGPVEIEHENTLRKSSVRSNVVGRDLVGFSDELMRRVASEIQLPSGYFVEYGGEYENQRRSAKRLSIVIPMSIAVVFVLLLMKLGSVLEALLVLINIPFAFIGGIFGLYLSGEYMSVPASVGFIALMGVAVLNGVVMLGYFKTLKSKIADAKERVITGSLRRLRPVLMTAFIAALGLIPMLFSSGPGSEIHKPLAIVVTSGLLSSTFLTLVLLPILYYRFVARKDTNKL